jgi:hypothetical protein
VPKIDVSGIKPRKELFHNEKVDVYPRTLKFEEIKFWPDNLRTILTFDLLKSQNNKTDINAFTLNEIVDFLKEQKIMKLPELAKSIKDNNVRVPLIICDDGRLLDGNRRYFACAYLLFTEKERPPLLDLIPVKIIKKSDIDEKIEYKILAEANFVSDYKIPWTLDVKARVIYEYFKKCVSKKMSEEAIYSEIKEVFSLKKSEVKAYVESIELSKEFIENPKLTGKKEKLREVVQDNFVYFWEFRNKAMFGRGALSPKDLETVKKLFFLMMRNDRFKNMKQVEPMIKSFNSSGDWALMIKTGGLAIDEIEINFKENRSTRSAEDKVRNFLNWLDEKVDISTFSKATYGLLEKIKDSCSRILNARK